MRIVHFLRNWIFYITVWIQTARKSSPINFRPIFHIGRKIIRSTSKFLCIWFDNCMRNKKCTWKASISQFFSHCPKNVTSIVVFLKKRFLPEFRFPCKKNWKKNRLSMQFSTVFGSNYGIVCSCFTDKLFFGEQLSH